MAARQKWTSKWPFWEEITATKGLSMVQPQAFSIANSCSTWLQSQSCHIRNCSQQTCLLLFARKQPFRQAYKCLIKGSLWTRVTLFERMHHTCSMGTLKLFAGGGGGGRRTVENIILCVQTVYSTTQYLNLIPQQMVKIVFVT